MPSGEIPKLAEETIEILIKLGHYVEETERARGRVKFHCSFSDLPKVVALLGSPNLEEGLKLIPGLIKHEVSAFSRSATIYYDPLVIKDDFWDDFKGIRTDSSKEAVVRGRFLALFGDGGGAPVA